MNNKITKAMLLGIAGIGMLGFGLWSVLATNEPVLTISRSGTNFVVGITNGTTNGVYELYYTPVLGDSAYPWTLLSTNAAGQTNFTVAPGANPIAFFFVGVGNDWDGDGIPNYRDANPNSASIGQLAITIDSPTNGASLY